jgi:exosortase
MQFFHLSAPMKARPADTVQDDAKLPFEVLIAVCAGAALVWVYWPGLSDMASRWSSQSQYSHGYLVPLFAAYLLWMRRGMLYPKASRGSFWGLAFLVVGLGLRYLGDVIYFDWLTGVSLLPCLAGVFLLGGGWQALGWAWPAIGFLVFMIPLPYALETGLAVPLRRVATAGSTYVLQLLGFTAYATGNIIRLGDVSINVVDACNGLSMLLIFFGLSTAVVILSKCSIAEKALILLSTIPIALASNIVRIVVTGVLCSTVGVDVGLHFHDSVWAALLSMLVGLGLLWIELRLFSWILVAPLNDKTAPIALAGLGGGRKASAVPRNLSGGRRP